MKWNRLLIVLAGFILISPQSLAGVSKILTPKRLKTYNDFSLLRVMTASHVRIKHWVTIYTDAGSQQLKIVNSIRRTTRGKIILWIDWDDEVNQTDAPFQKCRKKEGLFSKRGTDFYPSRNCEEKWTPRREPGFGESIYVSFDPACNDLKCAYEFFSTGGHDSFVLADYTSPGEPLRDSEIKATFRGRFRKFESGKNGFLIFPYKKSFDKNSFARSYPFYIELRFKEVNFAKVTEFNRLPGIF